MDKQQPKNPATQADQDETWIEACHRLAAQETPARRALMEESLRQFLLLYPEMDDKKE